MKILVCEDGSEYTERFRRFLGGEFEFVRAAHFHEALSLLSGARALLLDLDFSRTDPARLVDESGRAHLRLRLLESPEVSLFVVPRPLLRWRTIPPRRYAA